MLVKPARGTIIGVALIATLMGLFYLLPKLTRQNKFSLNTGSAEKANLGQFPLDRELTVLEIGPNRVVTAKGKRKISSFLQDSSGGLLINFWATWCPPCIEEFPSLEYLHRQLTQKKDGALPRVVAISVDDGIQEITDLFKSLEFTPSLTVLLDPAGDFSTAVGTTKFPETYLVTKDSRIVQKWLGPQNWLSGDVLGVLGSLAKSP